jgi:hypothetical protein
VGLLRRTPSQLEWIDSTSWLHHRREGTASTLNLSAAIATALQYNLSGIAAARWSCRWIGLGATQRYSDCIAIPPFGEQAGTAVWCKGL